MSGRQTRLTFSAPSEIAHQINDSGSQVVFVDPSALPGFEEARKLFKRQFPASRVILLTPPEKRPAELKHLKTVTEIYGQRGKAEKFTGDEVHNTAWLCYSSGTTGLPKGVMTTNHNMTSQLQALNIAYEPLKSGKDSAFGVLPFSHIYGLTIVLLQPLTVGVPLVVFPRFDEIAVLTAVQKVGRLPKLRLTTVQNNPRLHRPSDPHCAPSLHQCGKV